MRARARWSPRIIALGLSVLLLMCASLGCASGVVVRAHDTENVEQTITRLKEDLVRAYETGDVSELDRIYSDDFTVTDADGVTRTKQSEMERLEREGSTLDGGTYTPVEIRIFGDIAVMSGLGDLYGTGPDGEWRSQYYSFNVFLFRDGRWQYAAAFVP